MLVEINGTITDRLISHIETTTNYIRGNPPGSTIQREVPVLKANEEIVWRIGNSIPVIIQKVNNA